MTDPLASDDLKLAHWFLSREIANRTAMQVDTEAAIARLRWLEAAEQAEQEANRAFEDRIIEDLPNVIAKPDPEPEPDTGAWDDNGGAQPERPMDAIVEITYATIEGDRGPITIYVHASGRFSLDGDTRG